MNYILHIVVMTAIILPTILGYNLILGRGKILHFGSVGVSLVTAYGIVLSQREWGSYPLAILVGLASALIISALFAWMALRLEGDGFGILSIAMHLAILTVVLNWAGLTRGALGITPIPRMAGLQSLPMFALVSILIAILWTFIMVKIDRSSLGRSLSALAEHRSFAESMGISRPRAYFLAFLVGAIGCVLTNLLYPQYLGILHPNDYAFVYLIFFITCVVAGKPGSVLGATLAVILLTTLKEGLRFIPMPYDMIGPLRLLLFGVILIVAVWWRRKELFPVQRTV